MDGDFTKLLKCSMSPTIAKNFNLSTPGFDEHSVFRAKLSDLGDRSVEGTLLTKHITVSKEDLDFERPVLVLIFASSDHEDLKTHFTKAFTEHAFLQKGRHISVQPIHPYDDSTASQCISNARKEFADLHPDVDNLKPAIIGLFRKPGTDDPKPLELKDPRRTYNATKLFCHKKGYHFAGTFFHHTVKSGNAHRMKMLVVDMISRLKTQSASAAVSKPVLSSMDEPCKTLLLGIHVTQLNAAALMKGELDDSAPPACKERPYRWYSISITAKWSESDSFLKARTLLVKSCDLPKGIFSVAPAMDSVKKTIFELVGEKSLAGTKIIVFRAGVPAERQVPKEDAHLKAAELKNAADTYDMKAKPMPTSLSASSSGKGSHDFEDEKKPTDPESPTAMKNKDRMNLNARKPNANKSKALVYRGGLDGANEVIESETNAWNSKHSAEEHSALAEALSNTELPCFKEWVKAENASLAYLRVGVNSRARLFEPDGLPLCGREDSTILPKGPQCADFKVLSTVLATPSNDYWMLQKVLPKKAGPSTPLPLEIQWVDQDIIDDGSLLSSLSQASWDFPKGTWSSKDLSCIALAKKANRHAERIIRFVNGEPVLAEVHEHLKDSLYFI